MMTASQVQLVPNSSPFTKDETFSYWNTVMNNFMRGFLQKKETILKDAMVAAGIDIDDLEFLKTAITRVIKEWDKFEHYYLHFETPEEKRIISIERDPFPDFVESLNNPNRFILSAKYY